MGTERYQVQLTVLNSVDHVPDAPPVMLAKKSYEATDVPEQMICWVYGAGLILPSCGKYCLCRTDEVIQIDV